MKTVRPTERGADQSHVKSEEVSAKGRTRLLPAGTLERALQSRPSDDQSDTSGSTKGKEGRNA